LPDQHKKGADTRPRLAAELPAFCRLPQAGLVLPGDFLQLFQAARADARAGKLITRIRAPSSSVLPIRRK